MGLERKACQGIKRYKQLQNTETIEYLLNFIYDITCEIVISIDKCCYEHNITAEDYFPSCRICS